MKRTVKTIHLFIQLKIKMSKITVSYEGFKPEIAEDYPTFVNELLQILPKGAVFVPYVEKLDEGYEDEEEPYYWVVQQNGNEMFVLYDDEGYVEYTEGSAWDVTANAVLNFMDKVSMKLYESPSRLNEDSY